MSKEIDMDRPMLPVSVVTERLGIHCKTLELYSREKILFPEDTPSYGMLYSINDLEKCKFIKYLAKGLGIPLAGIKIVMKVLEKLEIAPDKYIEYVGKLLL